MKTFIRNTLLAAAGVVAMSLPAHAMNSTTSQDTPLLNATTAKSVQLAQKRNENPGGPGLRNENPGGPGLRNENPGGPGLKKKVKKPKKKAM
jgi:hypothetical protein